jgi:uracil-DNA glycosylase
LAPPTFKTHNNMDLFNQIDPQKTRTNWADNGLGYWADVLPLEILMHLYNVETAVRYDSRMYKIHPNTIYEALKIFRLVERPEDIKCVIIGQDPYYNGNATGLAFGCKDYMSASLKKIIEAIQLDQGYFSPKAANSNKDLEYLAKQGVFLYNTALTVRDGKPGSHMDNTKGKDVGWGLFTKGVIKTILKFNRDVTWLCWGAYAKKVMEPFKHQAGAILKASHPSYAARQKTIWKCDHFSKVNTWLTENGKEPIIWL